MALIKKIADIADERDLAIEVTKVVQEVAEKQNRKTGDVLKEILKKYGSCPTDQSKDKNLKKTFKDSIPPNELNVQEFIDYVNALLYEINSSNRSLYDSENPEFYVDGIYYDSKLDKVFLKYEEDKKCQ